MNIALPNLQMHMIPTSYYEFSVRPFHLEDTGENVRTQQKDSCFPISFQQFDRKFDRDERPGCQSNTPRLVSIANSSSEIGEKYFASATR